ncbi:DMT family transporter [Acidisphaera sp. S103]|uniref:DMT family transporter n=1 Tax=Acidisphaera sp. S103 TaxID=1747223 RepID=UPI0020B155F1|nr:DMT family transporter [Acidisphaera sp. S103]
MTNSNSMSRTDWALLLILSVLWGGSFFFSKVAVAALPPMTIVFVRFAAASVLVYLYARTRSIRIPCDTRSWLSFAGMGLLNNLIPAGLIVWGQTMIPSGLASAIIATTPIFSIAAIRLTSSDEQLSLAKLLGMALGLIGVAILFRLGAKPASDVSPIGIAACLGAAVSYGCANALGKRFRRLSIPPVAGALGQMTCTAVMAFPLMMLLESPWQLAVPDAPVWMSMAGLVVVSTALGYVVFFRLLATAGATNTSLVTLLIPITAVLLGGLVLGETLSTDQVVGMLSIALGLIAIDGRALNWAFNLPTPDRNPACKAAAVAVGAPENVEFLPIGVVDLPRPGSRPVLSPPCPETAPHQPLPRCRQSRVD